jgi:chromate transport protein ChrA
MQLFELIVLQIRWGNIVEGIIYGIGAVFSILLLALSISAYRDTGMKRIKYAIVAFGLFAVFLFYEFIDNFFRGLNTAYADIIVAPIVLAIVILFFLGIVKKDRQ